MKIFQSARLSANPLLPNEAATKDYVDQASGAVGGGVFFTGAVPTSTGNVGSKQFVPGTVPANRVLSAATSDSDGVTVSLFTEGTGAFYSPTITITSAPLLSGLPSQLVLVEDSFDRRAFTGNIALNLTVDVVLTAVSSTGATASLNLFRAGAGPALSSLLIGAYPGAQTEVKAGDVVVFSGAVENSAAAIEVLAGQAVASTVLNSVLGSPNSGGAGFKTFSGTFVVSNLSGNLPIIARARNNLGTWGANLTSSNTITLNQTYPSIAARVIAYPIGQQALKASEVADITAAVTNATSVLYSSSADLVVGAPTVYAPTKQVTRIGGAFVQGVNNYTITANRAANNATSSGGAAVTIANVAATASILIVGSPARLVRSPTGTVYTVRITPTQPLLSAPTLVASSGTWSGVWTFNAGSWSRSLVISDNDPTGAHTFSSLTLPGLAGIVGTVITAGTNYTVGGFSLRSIPVPAFARFVPIGTTVTDITKTRARYGGTLVDLTLQLSTASVFQGYTIVDSAGNFDPNGDHVFISDEAFAGANTTGTLLMEVEEVA